MENPTRLEVGAEPIPGYRLTRMRGRGAFGEVWEAVSKVGTLVALKFLPCAKDGRASQETRAIQTIRQISHPHLTRIDEVQCIEGYLAIVMELADGSLQDLLEAYQQEYNTPIPLMSLGPPMAQAANALDFLNGRRHLRGVQLVGLQHCDVKPSNMLLFGETLKLSDFSLMTTTQAASHRHRRAGTPGFVAPEVVQGRLSDHTDQYSLAATYCLLRGGRLPFECAYQFTEPGRRAPDLTMLPASERPAVGRALAPSPIDRWPTCGEFVAQLWTEKRGSDRAKTERRGTARFPSARRAGWRLLGDQLPTEEVDIRDVSSSGVGLVHDREFSRGALVALRVGADSEGSATAIYARVARSIQQPDGSWLVGCKFVRKLEPAEIEHIRSTEAEHV
jgi:serine/threonine-protein kinase